MDQTQAWYQEIKVQISPAQEGISRNGQQRNILSDTNSYIIGHASNNSLNFGHSQDLLEF